MYSINFEKVRVLIVGDVMLDRYYDGTTDRISPEAPIPVLKLGTTDNRAGGAANVALNLAALGVQVSLLGFVGNDEAANTLESLLDDQGVSSHLIRVPELATIQKMRFISQNQQLLRCDIEQVFTQAPHAQLVQQFQNIVNQQDVCILSDYAKGTVADPQCFIQAASLAGVQTLIDPKGKDLTRYAGATLVKPNQKEFNLVFGAIDDGQQMQALAQQYLVKHDVSALLLTQGSKGMTLYQADKAPQHYSCEQFEVKDVSGAGDTVIAMTALCLALQQNLQQAVAFANKAAGLVVMKAKTSALTRWECRRLLLRMDRDPHNCRFTEEEVIDLGEELAAQGKKLVMTNGCFDLLHPGHIGYLREAREAGDFLLVAINTDESVKRLKGPGRPAQPAADRCAVLEALGCVDAVITFSEDTPLRLINLVKPRVLVKGVDYTDLSQIIGAQEVLSWGGEVKLLGPAKHWSSTDLLNKSDNMAEEVV